MFGTTEPKRAVEAIERLTDLHITPHDCRRSWASFAEKLGIGGYTIKSALNHLSGGDVTGEHYVHINADDLRESMQRVEDWILAQAEPGTVVKLPQRA